MCLFMLLLVLFKAAGGQVRRGQVMKKRDELIKADEAENKP